MQSSCECLSKWLIKGIRPDTIVEGADAMKVQKKGWSIREICHTTFSWKHWCRWTIWRNLRNQACPVAEVEPWGSSSWWMKSMESCCLCETIACVGLLSSVWWWTWGCCCSAEPMIQKSEACEREEWRQAGNHRGHLCLSLTIIRPSESNTTDPLWLLKSHTSSPFGQLTQIHIQNGILGNQVPSLTKLPIGKSSIDSFRKSNAINRYHMHTN